MRTAQTILGNSGGAVLRPRNGHYELIGVPSRIAVTMTGMDISGVR